jgi:hypothetical protein
MTYHVITESTGWSFIIDQHGNRDGPWRYRWEAEEVAKDKNDMHRRAEPLD